jgi:multiple sugar transport system substrate-binding protein
MNVKNMKKIDRILFCLALAVCLGGILSILKFLPKRLSSESVTLVFSQWWQDELEEDALASIIREFEAQNLRISVKLDDRPYGEMGRGLLDKAAVYSSPPDVVGISPQWLYPLIREGVLESLEPYQREAPLQGGENGFSRDGDRAGEYDTWAIPLVSFMSPLFYNTALLEQAGFDRPPKTRSEFFAYAQAVTDPRSGRYGAALALSPDSPQGLYRDVFSWILTSGVDLSRGGVDFTDSLVIDTLDFLNQLYQAGLLSPSPFTKTEAEKYREFSSGRLGMMVGSLPEIHRISAANPRLAFSISTIPSGDRYIGRPIFALTTWYGGIHRKSLHKNEAWAFLSFLAERRAFLASKAHTIPPGNRDAAPEHPLYDKVYDIYEAGVAVDEFIPWTEEPDLILREELLSMFEGKKSPVETARAIQRRREGNN